MPPGKRRNSHSCCIVWSAGLNGQMIRGCIHCLRVVERHDWAGGADLLERLVVASQRGHAQRCKTAVRPARRVS